MVDELRLFRGYDYKINDNIVIRHPTLGEICDYGEEKYYNMVYVICSTPSDHKVQLLDNFGIDYEQISEFELFCMMCKLFSKEDTSILFGDFDFQLFDAAENTQTNQLVLYDKKNNIVIDHAIYTLLTDRLRLIHGFEKNIDVAGNEHTKQYMLEKERRKLKRANANKQKSILAQLISSMVNCEQFKYDYNTVWTLPIYVFMDSVKRIQKIKNYNHLMQGVYAGTIDSKSLSQESFNWMGSLSES